MVNDIFLGKGPTWSVVDKPSDTLLERTDFPFAFRYQLQQAFLMDFVLLFPPRNISISSKLVTLLAYSYSLYTPLILAVHLQDA